jgi:two-component system response regulator YesN
MDKNHIYRILLVDDEALILSGIKSLIDWGKNGYSIAGTAGNGTEALEKIEKLKPDIVICDIGMPGISGLDVLKKADTEFPGTVFIILTNFEEFELARESLHYRASDYMVKNNLEAATLEKALERAKEEWENRNKLGRVEEADVYLKARLHDIKIRKTLTLLLRGTSSKEDVALLAEEGMLTRFAFAFIPLNFAVLPEYPNISVEDRHKIFEWQTEITERLGSSFFPHSILLPRAASDEGFLLFVWETSAKEWESGIVQFRERLIKTSNQITRLRADVIPSAFFETGESENPARALVCMEEQYNLNSKGTHLEVVKKARQYILNNVEKRIMLHDVAGFVGISPGYLSTLFRKEYNQNMMDFINETKINRACELLWENKYRINEIADMLGYESAFYFSRVFHRRTGFTPSEYQTRGVNPVHRN